MGPNQHLFPIFAYFWYTSWLAHLKICLKVKIQKLSPQFQKKVLQLWWVVRMSYLRFQKLFKYFQRGHDFSAFDISCFLDVKISQGHKSGFLVATQGVVFSRDAMATIVAGMRLFLPPRKSRFLNGTEILTANEYFFERGKMSKTQKLICHPQLDQMSGKVCWNVLFRSI